MSAVPLRLSRRIGGFPIGEATFFVFLYSYLWLVIDPGLIYHGRWLTMTFPAFQVGLAFLKEFVIYAGGPVGYVSAFLCQLYYYPWLGALIITGVAGLLTLATWVFLARLTGARPFILHFVPAVLLALAYNRYHNPLAAALAFLVAMGCLCVYVQATLWREMWRLVLFLVLSAFAYYVAGGAYLIYAVLCGLSALVAERSRRLAVVYLLCGAAVPYAVGKFLLRLRVTDAYFRFWPFHQDSDAEALPLVLCFCLSFLLVPLLALLWPVVRPRLQPVWGTASFSPGGRLFGQGLRRIPRWALKAAASLVVGVGVLGFSFDRSLNAVFEIEYYALHKRWPELLEVARRLPIKEYSFFVNWDVNRALYHTGRLPYDMFSYPQNALGLAPSPKVFPAYKLPHPLWVKLSDVLLELGRVNEAEHTVYEALEMMGDQPRIIQQAAVIALAKGEIETARILLSALSKQLLYGRWAKQYLRNLEADPTMSWDDEIQRLRSVMVDTDLIGWMAPAKMLAHSLAKNQNNRMAFEYLMADHLLRRDLAGLVQNIGRLADFGYSAVPRHYEEALVLYMAVTRQTHYQYGLSISGESAERYREFCQTLARYGRDLEGARKALARDFGNTYYFYYKFDESGVGR